MRKCLLVMFCLALLSLVTTALAEQPVGLPIDPDPMPAIELPATVTDIAADAFEGTADHLTIICPDGSAAASFAEAAGIPHAPQ